MSAPVIVLPTDPATDRQRALIPTLAAERGVTVDVPEGLTAGEASERITALLKLPKIPREPTAAGFYVHDGTLYRVRVSKAGNSYAERLDLGNGRTTVPEWALAPGWAYRLTADEAITEEDGKAIAARFLTPRPRRKSA